ncbi:cysteine-rich motor neuron 1 protein [Microcaecilia unicolor]|uniref:Cysteine-rich motor neuron 1 protein-like n=1 Tax=Microcaecilia unicolor TaxID=1415580 RepID=A0A6P7ZVV9_9AMPH|nr:cysteine-rich motor neuron 1 protein-like [Microcaecilia unicolor]XP_030077959.1 cysteine-rich motor neuron 1 protein-like [Microcaecilia unicolor]
MVSGMFFWLLLACAAEELVAFNCTECDTTKCPPSPISCPGRSARDPCGCCEHCARQEWEPCGGENWELGYCDLRYRCAALNGTGNVEIPDTGVCKYEGFTGDYWMDDDVNCPPVYGCQIRMGVCDCATIRTCVDYFSYIDDATCRKNNNFYMGPPSGSEEEVSVGEFCWNAGCDLVGGRCECSTNNQCGGHYKFSSQKECNDALLHVKCVGVLCPEPLKLDCPGDSVITKTYTAPGECCTTVPSFCTCNFGKCAKCPYGQTKVNVWNATGIPGDCCDKFYCVKT